MASVKDSSMLEILYINKVLKEMSEEIAETTEYIGYLKALNSRKPSIICKIDNAENKLQGLKYEYQDLLDERESEFTACGFTEEDFGHASEEYADAKWYSDKKSCPDNPFTDGDKSQKYRALNNYNIRYADYNLCKKYAQKFFKSIENDLKEDWSDEEKAAFAENMGISLDAWRSMQRPLFNRGLD